MAKLVSKTYGDALFAVACEEECIDEFFEAAVCVVDSLWANEEFSKLMNHPNIGKEEKIKIVEETFSQKIPKEIIGLMTLLIKKRACERYVCRVQIFYRTCERREEDWKCPSGDSN